MSSRGESSSSSSSSSVQKSPDVDDEVLFKWLMNIYGYRTKAYYATRSISAPVNSLSQHTSLCKHPTFDFKYSSSSPHELNLAILFNCSDPYVSLRQYIMDPRIKIYCRKLAELTMVPDFLSNLPPTVKQDQIAQLQRKQIAMNDIKNVFNDLTISEQQSLIVDMTNAIAYHWMANCERQKTADPLDIPDGVNSKLKCNCTITIVAGTAVVLLFPPEQTINVYCLIDMLQNPKYDSLEDFLVRIELQRQIMGHQHLYAFQSMCNDFCEQFKTRAKSPISTGSSSKHLSMQEVIQRQMIKMIEKEKDLWETNSPIHQRLLAKVVENVCKVYIAQTNNFFIRQSSLLTEMLANARLKTICEEDSDEDQSEANGT